VSLKRIASVRSSEMNVRREGEGLEEGWWAFKRGCGGIWESWRGLRWRYWREGVLEDVIFELGWSREFFGWYDGEGM